MRPGSASVGSMKLEDLGLERALVLLELPAQNTSPPSTTSTFSTSARTWSINVAYFATLFSWTRPSGSVRTSSRRPCRSLVWMIVSAKVSRCALVALGEGIGRRRPGQSCGQDRGAGQRRDGLPGVEVVGVCFSSESCSRR